MITWIKSIRERQKGNTTKSHEEMFISDIYIHFLDCGNSFHGYIICSDFVKINKLHTCSIFHDYYTSKSWVFFFVFVLFLFCFCFVFFLFFKKEYSLEVSQVWIQVSSCPLMRCVPLDKLFNLSEPHFYFKLILLKTSQK